MSTVLTVLAFWVVLSVLAALLFGAIARRRNPRDCRCGACDALFNGGYISAPPPDESMPAADAAETSARFDQIMRREYS